MGDVDIIDVDVDVDDDVVVDDDDDDADDSTFDLTIKLLSSALDGALGSSLLLPPGLKTIFPILFTNPNISLMSCRS